jgi:aldose 1-epimerase
VRQPVSPEIHPGGQAPIVLERSVLPGSLAPEFISATLLPGRGMDVLQITANLPEKGEVELLAGPDLATANAAMTGVNEDSDGQADLNGGGAFLTPWAGSLGGMLSNDQKEVGVTWRGKIFNVPANTVESAVPSAFGGLLLKQSSDNAEQDAMPDGGSATATFNTDDFDGRWPSKSETKVFVLLSGRSMEMTVDVKNVGTEVLPAGIGWAPRFAIVSGDRAHAMLHLPAEDRSVGRDQRTAMPSGKIEAVTGTRYDFNARQGVALGSIGLDDTFVHLKTQLDEGPVIELRDPGSNLGMKITALSPSIKAIHVFAPADASYVSISPQTNVDDPFGKEWAKAEDTGMAMLQPGQTLEWKIRVELFALETGGPMTGGTN